ncbi:MAG TPA: isoprenylcysteine carboxylmethyltransferase family protein [Steroidobacteraceae bacterium]|nr:isoprenylcysteine carboxylmethyltransferase family protein [Steroidobacteraceae bacterium]
MTRSDSTPRIRILQAYYVLLLIAVAICRPALTGSGIGRLLELGGLALVGLAALGRIWTTLYIAGQKDARITVTGPYARCRHPLYALSILASAGLGLATRSLTLAAITAVLSTALHVAAALAEERKLTAMFGREYSTYAANVPRFWPAHATTSSPGSVQANAAIYWKAFLDAGSMLGLYVAMELIAAGRDAGLWPTLVGAY